MGTSPVHASDGVSDVSWSTSLSETVQVYDIDENRVRSVDSVTLTQSGEYKILLDLDYQGGHPWEPWTDDTILKFRMEIGETNLERADSDQVSVKYGSVQSYNGELIEAYLGGLEVTDYFVSSGDTLNNQIFAPARLYEPGKRIYYAVKLENAEFNKGPFGFGDNDRTTIKNIRVTRSYEGQNVEETYSFSVSSNQIQSTTGSATLSFNHEATSAGDPESNPLQIDINGNTVYSNVPVSGDVITTSFDPSVLNEGDNTVRVYVDEATGTDDSHDDYGYEITDVSVDVPTDGDYDDDGLYNWKESQIGTDPTEKDTDGDGLGDSAEVADYGTDPTKKDTDGDGLSDFAEVTDYGTDPTEKDTDGDGLDDQKEVNDSPTDPTEKDTDDDGVDDSSDDAPVTAEDKDGYQDNDGVPENPPPTVSLSGISVTEGQQQPLSANANDPEGKSLNYEWSLNGPGRLTGNGEEVVYKAPSSPDGITRERTADVTVTVTTTGETRGQSEKSATATAQVDLEDVNPTPSVSLPDKQLSEGGTITIRASANNPEDDGISYQWSKDGPGSLSSSGETATYTAPSDISESVSTSVSVTVTEPQGRSASASATVSVKNNRGDDDTDGDGILNRNDEAPNEPEDKDGYQDTDGDPENPPPTVSLAGMSVTEGQQQTVSADASDPEGDSLNYEWGLSGAGQLSTTSGQSVTYTAPRDISLDKSATVSVTVTEPDSGKSSQAEATISIPDNPDPAQFDIAISNTNNPPAGEQLEVTAEITNTGEQSGQATVQLDTTAGEIKGTQTAVNLGGGDSTTETLTVDTTGVDPGSYTATVSAGDTAGEKQFTIVENPDPAQFAVEITNMNNPAVGERLEVTAEITNTGEQSGQATVQLDTTAGEIEGTQTTVDLGGGDSTTETLTVDTTGVDPGSYTATVTASAATGTGTGTDENPGDAASFEIAAAPAEFQLEFLEGPTQIITGESYSPTVEVTNNGAGAGTQDISYVLENPDGLSTGIEAVEPSVELAAGESEQITFDFEAQETDALSTGTYNHVFKSADDESVREVELAAGFSIAQFDRNDTGQIEFDDLRYATREYNRENITFEQLRRVLRAYNTDQQV